tara:strand:- start:1004 stop:1504 length:501 start_codon:yes stop_codon:yes gene_type:complete
MKIQKRASNHPNKVFWYCKVCKARREEWKNRKKYSVYPFCSPNCKSKFHRKHAFTHEGYKRYFTKERFKIWLHNQISVFTPQFTSIREDHSFRKLVREEMWPMRWDLTLNEAILFIAFMLHENGIAYVKDKALYSSIYGSHIATSLMQNFDHELDYLDEARQLLGE